MHARVSAAAVVIGVAIGLTACTSGRPTAHLSAAAPLPAGPAPDATTATAKIKHVVVIMQESRSFDSYFGTYPGADGIPMNAGTPTV